MIYTVTLNPAMDCVMQLDEFVTGRTNRASVAFCTAGGKGVNVSLVLKALGVNSTATGFLAGFTGQEIQRQLDEKGVSGDFVFLEKGNTRINVKIKGSSETEVNGVGAVPEEKDAAVLMEKLSAAGEGDIVVLAGSIPNGMSTDIYADIMKRAEGRGVRFAVDTEGEALLKTLPYKPFLIKPNHHELGMIFGCEINTPEKAAEYGMKLREKGAANVLVSMAGDGAVLCSEDGEVHYIGAAKGTVVNSVGAGDSMVAGFIAGWLKYGRCDCALRMGAAAGAACAFSEKLPECDDVMRIMAEMEEA